jgi:uncharacterized protein YdeI (YjbR/CyaY-like superfamily)
MLKKEKLHTMPKDFKLALAQDSKSKQAWGQVTELAQNEWICWIISAKKTETRERRLERAIEELKTGKKRPCCFAGCPHR